MRRAGETLPFNNTLGKVEHSFKRVPWTFAPDGVISSGSRIMISSVGTGGHLAVDLGTP